jgi:hypothetical protein
MDLTHTDRIREAFRRDETGTARRDGFPQGGDSAGSTGPGDPTGNAVTARPMRDPHHEDCQKIAADLRAIVDAFDGIVLALDRIDQRSTAEDVEIDRAPVCEHHARHGHTVEAWRYGDVGGKLSRPMHLCQSCVNQVSRHGAVPDEFDAKGSPIRRVSDSRRIGTGGAFIWTDRIA